MRKVNIKKAVDVLLVEDNPGDVRLIQEAMKDAGFRNTTVVVPDGVEALAALRREGRYSAIKNIDIVILDLNLPKKDGREVLREIKSDDRLKHIPVVVLSSSGAEEDIERSYSSYANCYIIKPLEMSEYADVIKRIESFWFGIARLPKRTINILLIEDNPADARLVEEMLSDTGMLDFELETVGSLSLGHKRMEANHVDIVIMDLNLPDSSGIETFVTTHRKFPRVPVLVLTGINDDELGVRTVQEGAQNYLVKQDLTAPFLVRSIRYSIERNKLRIAAEELMNMIVHEFRSPMAVVKESASQLLDGIHGGITAEQREYISMIHENAARMETLVADLLNMARIDIGTMKLDLNELDLGGLVKSIAAQYMKMAADKGLRIEAIVPERKIMISADRDRLTQAIVNILSNSIKFTGQGLISVSVTDDRLSAVCSIKDTGPGIPQDELPYIFDKYRQAGPKRAKGLGLGLYICKNIIELHGGSIMARSKAGTGTEMIFTLPKERK